MADNFFAGAVNSDITEKLDKYEELKNKYKELCEALVGIDATERYTHEDMLSYVYNLKNIEERFYDGQKT
jgi:hypothetical protein